MGDLCTLQDMGRFLLFGIVLACAAVLLYPVFAQETVPEKVSPDDEPGQETVLKITNGVEEAVRDVAKSNPLASDVLNAMLDFLKLDFFGLTVGQLLLSLTILFLSLLFRNILSNAILKRLVQFAKRNDWIDHRLVLALTRPLSFFLLVGGVYLSLVTLPFVTEIELILGNVFRGLSMLAVVWGVIQLSDLFAEQLEKHFARHGDSILSGFAPLIRKTLKVFVLSIGVLLTVDNLGYNVTGILATLGLGTAAVALAAQDSIKNAFGTLMIVLDRPFKVGDWIQVGDKVDGNVESIGLRSTKVRTWPKTIISIPNGVLANEYINNWSRMPKRRVKQIVGISYDATAKDMDELVEEIRQILRNDSGVHQEFILVSFTDFGESSLDILVYYFTSTIAWLDYMDIRQRVNQQIMEAVNRRGLSIAFPARSLYLEGPVASKMAGLPHESRWSGEAHQPAGSGMTSPP